MQPLHSDDMNLKAEARIEKLGKYHSFLKTKKIVRTENPNMLNANKTILILPSFGASWESLTTQVQLACD